MPNTLAPYSDPSERLLQLLSTMLIQLNSLQALVRSSSSDATLPVASTVGEGLTTLEQMARDMLAIVRSSAEDQALPELEGTTLSEALSRLVEEAAETLGLSSRVSFSGVDEQGRPMEHVLSSASERILYLFAQEALYQIRRHTQTRRLRLTLNYGQEEVQMIIEDDGSSINASEEAPAEAVIPSFTSISPSTDAVATRIDTPVILDLRYRIEQLGGSLEIGPAGEQGTRFSARVAYVSHVHGQQEEVVTTPQQAAEANTPPSLALERIRILVVDAQAVTRAGLHRLLESYPDLQVIGEASDGVQAVSETLELGPQVVLMDMQLPDEQSLEALRQIKQLNLNARVLLLSTLEREEYLYKMLRAGADGYILKDIVPDELAEAIRVVARGEVVIQPQLAGKLLTQVGKQGNANRYDTLTAREMEVLGLLVRGLRNKEIAARLYVSERTVNFHLANIYQKLNVSGRTEALSKAIEQGLIKT